MILPVPFAVSVAQLPGEGSGQVDSAEAISYIPVMELLHAFQMSWQHASHHLGDHHPPVFSPLPSRTVSSSLSKSISLARISRYSASLRPEPYRIDTMSQAVSLRWFRMALTSSGVRRSPWASRSDWIRRDTSRHPIDDPGKWLKPPKVGRRCPLHQLECVRTASGRCTEVSSVQPIPCEDDPL